MNKKNMIDLILIESSLFYHFNINKINLLSLFIFSIILISSSFLMLDSSSFAFCQDEEISDSEEKSLIPTENNIRNSEELYQQKFSRSAEFMDVFNEKIRRDTLSANNTSVFKINSIGIENSKKDMDILTFLNFNLQTLDELVKCVQQFVKIQNENLSTLKNLPMTPEDCYLPKEFYVNCCDDLTENIQNTKTLINNNSSFFNKMLNKVKIMDPISYTNYETLMKNSLTQIDNNLEEVENLKKKINLEEDDPFFN